MNEPKNPYETIEGAPNYAGWQEGYDARDTYLRSLVGKKGREALAKHIYEQDWPYQWEQLLPFYKEKYLRIADSLAPIIGGIADKLAEERIQERGLVTQETLIQVEEQARKFGWNAALKENRLTITLPEVGNG